MKTFLGAVAIFLVIIAFVIMNMVHIEKLAGEMLSLCEALPRDTDEFLRDHDRVMADVERLWTLWDKSVERFALTIGYDNIDRADDALTELYFSAKNRDGEMFVTAAGKFYDALRRLRELEQFNLQSIL